MRFRFTHFGCHGPHGVGRGGGEDRRHGHDRYEPRGSSGRTRMFEQGDLRFVILQMLGEKPAHGYEIIKAVEARFGGAYAPSPGIVYPTLTLLEEQGFIAVVDSEGPRKLYGLTDEGRGERDRCKADIERVYARMSELRQRYGGGDAPEIKRAMDNLVTALKLRMARGTEDISRITALLDEAARGIETL